MLADDVVLKPWTADYGSIAHYASAAVGALLVVAVGKALARRAPAPSTAKPPVDLIEKPQDER
jgi:hypothetical protein